MIREVENVPKRDARQTERGRFAEEAVLEFDESGMDACEVYGFPGGSVQNNAALVNNYVWKHMRGRARVRMANGSIYIERRGA